MRMPLLAFLALLFACTANAKEYGTYDAKRLLIAPDASTGAPPKVDLRYLDQMIADLAAHARNYPPTFDSPGDRQRAKRDAQLLSRFFELLTRDQSPNPGWLLRGGVVNGMGHNLDIPGAAEKADTMFIRLLKSLPDDPEANYAYGVFLSSVGRTQEALGYLEKADALGIVDARYALGMNALFLGDKEAALRHFEAFRQQKPGAGDVDTIIESIRRGSVEVRGTSR